MPKTKKAELDEIVTSIEPMYNSTIKNIQTSIVDLQTKNLSLLDGQIKFAKDLEVIYQAMKLNKIGMDTMSQEIINNKATIKSLCTIVCILVFVCLYLVYKIRILGV